MNNDSFSILRKFRPSDLNQVKSLFAEGMRANNAPEGYIRYSLSTDLSSVEDTYLVDRGTFLVMERLEDGHIVGMVGLQDLSRKAYIAPRITARTTRPREPDGDDLNDIDDDNANDDSTNGNDSCDDDEEDGNMCELRRMSVHSSERRKGRGAQLVEKFIFLAKEQGFSGIKLSTGAWMKAAIQFYVAMGFQAKGITQYSQDGKVVPIQHLEMLF